MIRTTELLPIDGENLRGNFSRAFETQSKYLVEATQCLEKFGSQVSGLIQLQAAGMDCFSNTFSVEEKEKIMSSLRSIKRVLDESQEHFWKMVVENRTLAANIDYSIHDAQARLSVVRAELDITNEKLQLLANNHNVIENCKDISNSVNDGEKNVQLQKERETVKKLRAKIIELEEKVKLAEKANILLFANEEFVNSQLSERNVSSVQPDKTSEGLRTENLELKVSKVTLLTQLKKAFASLEEKEGQMKQMMEEYKEHMLESDETIRKLSLANDNAEKIRWMLLAKAKEATDKVLSVQTKLDEQTAMCAEKDLQINQLRVQLSQVHGDKVMSCVAGNQSVDSGIKSLSLDLLSQSNEMTNHCSDHQKDQNQTEVKTRDNAVVRSTVSVGDLVEARRKRQSTARRLSQIFSKSKTKSPMFSSSSSLCSEYVDRMSNNDSCGQSLYSRPVNTWRAGDVYTWITKELGLNQYGRLVSENIKSGTVLLELSDANLEKILNVKDVLHRRKLRLAIEELKNPSHVLYPSLSTVTHDWVAHHWLCDLGLGQYSMAFDMRLVDGRVLNSLTKSDLEKHLGVRQSSHVHSILMGIELLRQLKFNKQELESRRRASPPFPLDDVAVWSNSQCVDWLQSIDLIEYLDHARSCGLHGAVLSLDPSFVSDRLASLLRIPMSKVLVRKHLAAEMAKLMGRQHHYSMTSVSQKSEVFTIRSQRPMTMYCDSGDDGSVFERSFKTSSGRQKRNFRSSLGHLFSRKSTSKCDDGISVTCSQKVASTFEDGS